MYTYTYIYIERDMYIYIYIYVYTYIDTHIYMCVRSAFGERTGRVFRRSGASALLSSLAYLLLVLLSNSKY